MPKLTTTVAVPKLPFEIRLGDQIYAIGSCFAETMAAKLQRLGFPLVLNPLGTLYNPVSLGAALDPARIEHEFFLHQGRWRCLATHGSLSSTSRQEARARLEQAERGIAEALERSRVLLLTLGTAQVFELVSEARVVANCHRLPQQIFRRRRLSVPETLEALQDPLCRWLEADPERQVILTVSPVRYLRDGALENSRGKAVLHLACAELEESHPRIHIFPAYEILVDELRSYRFYARDLVHPSDLAVDVIWERFQHSVFSNTTQELLKRLEKVATAAEHRLSPDSDRSALAQHNLMQMENLSPSVPEVHLRHLRRTFVSWLSSEPRP